MKRIIYPKPDNSVAIIIPTPEYLETHSIEEVAAMYVPPNTPYKIVNASDLPTDRTFRDAWEYQV